MAQTVKTIEVKEHNNEMVASSQSTLLNSYKASLKHNKNSQSKHVTIEPLYSIDWERKLASIKKYRLIDGKKIFYLTSSERTNIYSYRQFKSR